MNENIIHSKYALTAKDKSKDVDFTIKYDDYNHLHDHDYFEVIIILEGSYINHINAFQRVGNAYQCYLIRPSDEHRIIGSGVVNKNINIMFKSTFFKKHCFAMSDNLFDNILKAPFIEFSLNIESINRIIFLSNRIEGKNNQEGQLIYSLMFNLIITPVISNLDILRENIPSWCLDIINSISSSDCYHLSVKDIVSSSHYSHTHLNRLFKEYTGHSISKYIQKSRLNTSTNYLLYSKKDIQEISRLLGFKDVSHFNHLFKREYGLTPLEYRKSQSKDSMYKN